MGIHAPGDHDDEHEHHDDDEGHEHAEGDTHEHHDDSEAHHHEAGVPAIVVKPLSIAGAYQLRSLYRSTATQAVFPGEVLVKLYSILGDIRALLMYIAMGTQGLVGMAVALVAVMHLRQRQKQIGALRAFGVPRTGIFLLIWSGLMSLVFAGVAIGVGLGYVAAQAVAIIMSEKSGFVLPIALGEDDLWFVLLLLAVAAVVLTLPAVLSYRQSPAAALRGE